LKALRPENESERLAGLSRYQVLDTAAEPSFDRLTALAAELFSAPIAAVSLVEQNHLFFKSTYGMERIAVSREQSFCTYAILSNEVTVVPDAAQDPRFAHNPQVAGQPGIRFYAGAPLETPEGLRLGTLCVFDSKPRPMPCGEHLAALKVLAAQVMELLELHRARLELAAMRRELDQQACDLRESRELSGRTERRAALALEAGQMGYWERDATTDRITFSPGLAVLLGLDPATYDGTVEGWLANVHPDDRDLVTQTVQAANLSHETYTLKYRRKTADGSDRWITSRGTYRADAAGNFDGAQGVSWDSTAAEEAVRQLKLSEEQFRALSASAPVGVFRSDMSGNMTYANLRTAEIFGRPEADLLGPRWQQCVHSDDRGQLLESIYAANAREASWEGDFRLILPAGEVRWVSARNTMIRDERGQVVGKIGTIDDVTQRRQAMVDLQAAKEAAEEANRAKDTFLANVSHELRTPLNGVMGISSLLLDMGLNREQFEMATTIQESGRALLRVVNDMLDLSRIEHGGFSIQPQPFNLPATIQQTIVLLEPEARRKALRLAARYPAQLPPWYVGDAARIQQILLNFLSNAIKFTTAGEIQTSVEAVADGNLLFAVTDTGPGIPPEAQKKLFRPFSQVDGSSTRRNGGAGLGLAIARRLAELMGGSVGVISAPGHGSTFWLRLPLEIHQPPQPSEKATVPPAAHSAGRVLLVEDNPVNQKVAAGALRKLGWEADVAANGVIALDLYQKNSYAVVLMDCQMPEMDGYAATREIRNWESAHGCPNTPVVALTAHAMKGDRERCLAAGMDDYLTKPLAMHELRDALDRWTSLHACT
jgi:PAS domain S-box-containing protein